MFPVELLSKLVTVTALLVIIICTVVMFSKGRTTISSLDSWTPISSSGRLDMLTVTTEEEKNESVHCPKNQQILSPKIINNIKRFLFFVGYPRSSHSIVGSVLDAHPHIVVSHELKFMLEWDSSLFDKVNASPSPAKLYHKIYQKSMRNLKPGSLRSHHRKGYTLSIEHSCQGSFDKYIDVIGDKSGGAVTYAYKGNRAAFQAHFEKLKEVVGIPIKVVHVIRNPYDNIATMYLYKIKITPSKYRANDSSQPVIEKVIKPGVSELKKSILRHFSLVKAASKVIALIGRSNVLDVHHGDFVHHSRETIVSITEFLGVEAPEDYLKLCVDKIFKEINRSRNLLMWPDELRELVEQQMKVFPFLEGYSFSSD